jgi:tight adherence protein B
MTILPLITFGVFFAAIAGAYLFFIVRPERQAAGVVRRRLTPSKVKAALSHSLLKERTDLSTIGAFDALLRRSESQIRPLQQLIDQAGVKVTVGIILGAAGVLGFVAFYAVLALSGWILLALPVGALATTLPIAVLRFLRTRRIAKFEEQLPEALDLISRALRAGHAFTTGLEMIANEMPAPIGQEFRLLFDQQNYGMTMPDALKAFAERVPVLDARFFVTAVLIQRESGGNLAEVLDNLSSVIRDRFRVKRQMRVASAHGRITGVVLVCLPPVLGIVLMSTNREHRELMFGETLGLQMMAGAAILQGIGTLIIRKIINVPY